AFDVQDGEMTVTVETESINPDKKVQEYKGGSGAGPGKMYGKVAGGGAVKGKGAPLSPTPEGASVATQYMKIPAKYKDPASSGLSAPLKKGGQKPAFALPDCPPAPPRTVSPARGAAAGEPRGRFRRMRGAPPCRWTHGAPTSHRSRATAPGRP